MSPISKETIPNRALSGEELKSLLREDFDHLLANDGLLSPHIAYGRIAYDITLRKHMDNPVYPEDVSSIASVAFPAPAIAANPTLAAIESPPLAAASPDALADATRVSRAIDSPNLERIRTGMPIMADVKQQDGTVSQQPIQYPADPSIPDNVKLENVSAEPLPAADKSKGWWGSAKDKKVAAADTPNTSDPPKE